MSSSTSSANHMVSPCVTSYEPNAFINVDSQLLEGVNVSGIDSQFDISLNEADSIKLLNGFTVSGFSVDCRLGKKDPNMSALRVDLSGADFKSVIANAINTATNVASPTETIDKYLANQLRNAFKAAFGSYLPTGSITGGDGSAEINGIDTTQTKQEAADPATDERAAAGAVAVTLTTTITGFKVDVLTDASVAADNLVEQHAASSSSAPANIFRQIPKDSWKLYLNDASGWATTYLNTDALPMLKGDILTFVFDMDVNTAGADAPNATAEDVPRSGDQSDAYGEQKFSLNLANRRVAVNIRLTGQSSAAFDVGAGKLRVQPAASSAGENPGAGVNPADGANSGSTQ